MKAFPGSYSQPSLNRLARREAIARKHGLVATRASPYLSHCYAEEGETLMLSVDGALAYPFLVVAFFGRASPYFKFVPDHEAFCRFEWMTWTRISSIDTALWFFGEQILSAHAARLLGAGAPVL